MTAGTTPMGRGLRSASTLRLAGTARLVLPPLLVARLLGVGAVVVVAWTSTGHPFDVQDIHDRFRGWDAQSYIDIAGHGYPCCSVDYHDAFLPGYPLVLRGAGLLVGDTVLAGLLTSALAEFVALVYIARLVGAERDQRSAVFAVWCIALAPFALFLTAVYTESLFMAAAAASLYHARRGDHGRACVAAAVACATRITGVVLIPVLFVEWWRQGHGRPLRSGLSALVVVSPLLAYAWYMQRHVGDALAFRDAQRLPSFNHDLAPPWSGFIATWNTVTTTADPENRSIFVREILFGILGLLACLAAWVWPRFPRSWALYCSLVWLVSTSLSFWLSVPRYEIALFPLVLILADLSAIVRWSRPAIVAVSAAVMTWGSAIYASGRWLG